MEKYLDKKWVLFGAGKSEVLSYIQDYYKDNVAALVDNDSKKVGKKVNGLEIRPVSYLNDADKENTIVVVTTFGHWTEISEQLCSMGWENRFIIPRRDVSFFTSYKFSLYARGYDLRNNSFKPTMLNLELSSLCNCKCSYCPFHGDLNLKDGNKKLMTWDVLRKIVNMAKEAGTFTKLSPVGAGEIFVNPEWFEMLQYYLENVPTKHVSMFTNGMLLTEENIIKISKLKADYVSLAISIDGTTPDENDHYRVGSKYDVIKNNIRKIDELRKNGRLEHDFYVMIRNCHPLGEDEIAENNGVMIPQNVRVPQYLKNDYKDTGIGMYAHPAYAMYNEETAETFDKSRILKLSWPENYENRCTNAFYSMAVNYKGDLLQCSCNFAELKILGNVFEEDIIELWKNHPDLQLARKHLINGELEHDMCDFCTSRGMGDYYIMLK